MKMILVKKETRDRLISISKKGQTYDDIINELLTIENFDENKRVYSSELTSIKLDESTLNKLKEVKESTNLSYDDLINSLIDAYKGGRL